MTDVSGKVKRTVRGLALVKAMAEAGMRIFSMEEAAAVAPSLGIARSYLGEALHHLVRTGWLMRLRRGLYALAAELGGQVHEFEVAMELAHPAAISIGRP